MTDRPTERPRANRGLTAVAIDDDPMMLLVLERVCQRLDIRLVHSRSGEGLDALLTSIRPDLIIMDVRMPDVDGPALVKRIRLLRDSAIANAVIVFCSALTEDEIRLLVRHSGADGFVKKGVSISVLTEDLRAWAAEARRRAPAERFG